MANANNLNQLSLFSNETPVNQYSNSATYLASLYLRQDSVFHQWCMNRVDAERIIPAISLKDYFKCVSLGTDSVEAGIHGRELILDGWAEGEVYWDELTDIWSDAKMSSVPRWTSKRVSSPVNPILTIPTSLTDFDSSSTPAPVVDNLITQVMAEAEIVGNVVKLKTKLNRRDYIKIDQALKALGGSWNKKQQGHLFSEDPTLKIDQLIATGSYAKPAKVNNFGYFPTPLALALALVGSARLRIGMKVLEPSAGRGGITDVMADLIPKRDITVIEIQNKHADILRSKGYDVFEMDFMTYTSDASFDAIVMNPPFERQQDIDHVMHAWSMLKPGGRLVSIMSAAVKFRTNAKTTNFRSLLLANGELIDNEEQSFKESGTNVSTVMVTLDKPIEPSADIYKIAA